MENRNIIIILLAIIVVLSVIAGMMFLQSTNSKESSKVKITSDKSQFEGGVLSVQLTDSNKTAISKEKVRVTLTDKKGKEVVNEKVKTDSKGKAKLDLNLKKGNYIVNVTYGGNENYTGSNATQKLTIKEEVKEESTVDTSLYPIYSQSVGYCRIIETQEERGLVETVDGNYYVIAGDGMYTYGGRDSQGRIQLGSPVGK